MMKNELDMIEDSKSPFNIGLATLVSFVTVGFIPLAVYVYDFVFDAGISLFLWTSIGTSIAFVVVGWLKSYVNQTPILKSVWETLALGIVAASVAYFVGDILESLLVNS
jgi:VIT1/CCC1 family predicted Fe2+/Mn2+ transporter